MTYLSKKNTLKNERELKMKTTKIYFIDLSRYYILSFYEQLKINNGYSKNPNNSDIPNPNHTNINSSPVRKPHVIMNAVFSHGLRNFSDQQDSAILSNKITHKNKKSKFQDFKNNTTAISAQNNSFEIQYLKLKPIL